MKSWAGCSISMKIDKEKPRRKIEIRSIFVAYHNQCKLHKDFARFLQVVSSKMGERMMYLRAPTTKPGTYVAGEDEDSDGDYEVNSKTASKTKKNKESGSSDDSPIVKRERESGSEAVKQEKTKKAKTSGGKPANNNNNAPYINKTTDLESSYIALDAVDGKKSSTSTQTTSSRPWTDDEESLILLGLRKGFSQPTIVQMWPQKQYPRSGAVIKKMATSIGNDLRKHLGMKIDQVVEVPTDPERDGMGCFILPSFLHSSCLLEGTNAQALLVPFMMPYPKPVDAPDSSVNDDLVIFGFPVSQWHDILVGLSEDLLYVILCLSSFMIFLPVLFARAIRYRLSRLPYTPPSGLPMSGPAPLFVAHLIPRGYHYVRKYPQDADKVATGLKGVVLRIVLDQAAKRNPDFDMT